MIAYLLPTTVLKWFVAKDVLDAYELLNSIPAEKCYDSGYELYFNYPDVKYTYEADELGTTRMWYCNGAGFVSIRRRNTYLYGEDHSGLGMFGLSFERELLMRVARRKVREIKSLARVNRPPLKDLL